MVLSIFATVALSFSCLTSGIVIKTTTYYVGVSGLVYVAVDRIKAGSL